LVSAVQKLTQLNQLREAVDSSASHVPLNDRIKFIRTMAALQWDDRKTGSGWRICSDNGGLGRSSRFQMPRPIKLHVDLIFGHRALTGDGPSR